MNEQVFEYLVVLEPAEEGGYNVAVPDLDLYTCGDTRDHALEMAAAAVRGALETMREKGWAIPPPGATSAIIRVSA